MEIVITNSQALEAVNTLDILNAWPEDEIEEQYQLDILDSIFRALEIDE